MSDVTGKAIEALGSATATDRQLRPEIHAQSLPPEAGALKRVLTAPALQEIIQKYTTFSKQAADYQNRYKWKAKSAAIATFLAILFGCTLFLMLSQPVPPIVSRTATVVQAVLVVISFVLSLIVAFTKPFKAWMEARGEAENARLDLFAEVLKAQTAPGGATANELPLLPLQLEYVRRYLLDIERNYYRDRGNEHLAASRTARNWRIVAFLIFLVSILFPISWALQGIAWIPDFLQTLVSQMPAHTQLGEQLVLTVSIVVSALQGLLAAYAVISLDDRNAARYLVASDNLEDLAQQPLADARARAASGDRSGVLEFTALLVQEISSEHREWIALRKVAPALRLDQLASLRLPKLR
jgi:hypothetical protein